MFRNYYIIDSTETDGNIKSVIDYYTLHEISNNTAFQMIVRLSKGSTFLVTGYKATDDYISCIIQGYALSGIYSGSKSTSWSWKTI